MGACFGLCRKRSKNKRSYKFKRCLYIPEKDEIELELLVEEGHAETNVEEDFSDVWTMSGRIQPIVSPEKQKKNPFIQNDEATVITKSEQCLLENLCNEELEGTQLLPLDAHTLLASRAVQKRTVSCCSSTPPSSLELEWEHEGVLHTMYKFRSHPSSNVEDGSSVSGYGEASPESLEWDPCDQTNTDFETEQLINEIEQLASRALRETGDWTNR